MTQYCQSPRGALPAVPARRTADRISVASDGGSAVRELANASAPVTRFRMVC